MVVKTFKVSRGHQFMSQLRRGGKFTVRREGHRNKQRLLKDLKNVFGP